MRVAFQAALAERDGNRRLPIWIGLLEASAIASRLEGVEVGRPMTHDLMRDMLNTLRDRKVGEDGSSRRIPLD